MEKPDSEIIEDPRRVLRPFGGRDELNLAEFPITLLSDRVPKGCKTLTFVVDHRDDKNKLVTRKVTITGSDAYGLPTAIDDEILIALIQITKLKNEFTNATVYFSKYEILKLLGWPDDGRSYRRIEESVKRWTGVTVYYDNAWRDRETGSYASENFHFIDRSSFLDVDARKIRASSNQPELALSSFRWSDVIFQSFQAGSLKRLDISAYFSYTTSVAKRMYRFLDKRFWVKPTWEFDLKEFAHNRIGLSSKYNIAQIKNKLAPAIEELSHSTPERAAFLEPMDHNERYIKVSKGAWLVIFTRKSLSPALPDSVVPEPSGLVADLFNRGVKQEVAQELVSGNQPEFIALRIEVFDWIVARPNQRIIKESPVGYLIDSIRNRYITTPKGFVSQADLKKKREVHEDNLRREAEARVKKIRDEERRVSDKDAIKAYWDSLSSTEQTSLELAAGIPQSPLAPTDFPGRFDRRAQRDAYIRAKLGLPAESTIA
jgi:hypothetical protein